MAATNHSISRSDDRVIAGVLGGFADYFGVQPTILRLAAIFLIVATGLVPGVVTYGAAVVLMPGPSQTQGREITPSAPRAAE